MTSAGSKFCRFREPTTIMAISRPVQRWPKRRRGHVRGAATIGGLGCKSFLMRHEHPRVRPPQKQALPTTAGRPARWRPLDAEECQQQRREKSAEAAHGANQPGNGARWWENSGTNWKTAPLPMPSNAADPSAPTVNGIIEGAPAAGRTAPTGRIQDSTRAPPISSDSQPPKGRSSVARTTKPAVRKPASAGGKRN